MDRSTLSTARFGLTISLKKTEVLFQRKPANVGNDSVAYVRHFCYLGTTSLSVDSTITSENSCRLTKASSSSRKLWNRHDISLKTKSDVYKAVVLPALLYGCGTLTPLGRDIQKLNSFHMRCLPQLCSIKWKDKVSDTEVLSRTDVRGVEFYLVRVRDEVYIQSKRRE
jgi:hypothetical protein